MVNLMLAPPSETISTVRIDAMAELRVSELLQLLRHYHACYAKANVMPKLDSAFGVSLLNTYRSFLGGEYFPLKLTSRLDNRGLLFEILRSEGGGQVFFSLTKTGEVRGNHYHLRKVERFCVVSGNALIRLRRVGTLDTREFHVSANDPSCIDIPVLHSHNIRNIGTDDLLTLFWSNEIFDPDDPDTYPEEV